MFEITDFIGMIAFAMSGFFVASRSKLDLLGALISTFLTALCGGIIRDIALDRTPYTFTHNYPGLVVLSVFLLMILFNFHKRESIENKPFFIVSDSIGLVSFSISGALIALESDFNLAGVVSMAFVTAVGGGIVRDVIINEVPFVLKTGFYGTIALMIGIILYFLDFYNLISIYTITSLFFLYLVLSFIAYRRGWSIPLR